MATKSPFPGMDPYLQRYWLSVHNALVTYACDELNARHLPGELRADLTERVLVSSPDEAYRRRILPDVHVVDTRGVGPAAAGSVTGGGVAVAEPVLLRFPDERAVETAIHITDLDGSTLITAIEFLSASNKPPGADRQMYLRKRNEYLAGGVNLVEIDLFRGGDRTLDGVDFLLPPDRRSPHLVIVSRAHRPGDWEVTPLPFRHRLPAVRLPLRPTDPDILFDLQPLLDRAYANGRYPIDYGRPPDPRWKAMTPVGPKGCCGRRGGGEPPDQKPHDLYSLPRGSAGSRTPRPRKITPRAPAPARAAGPRPRTPARPPPRTARPCTARSPPPARAARSRWPR